jgi:hypothetical protein
MDFQFQNQSETLSNFANFSVCSIGFFLPTTYQLSHDHYGDEAENEKKHIYNLDVYLKSQYTSGMGYSVIMKGSIWDQDARTLRFSAHGGKIE